MPTLIAGCGAYLGLALIIAGPSFAAAQVPTRASEPRLNPAVQPTAQVPSQPTVATPQAAAPAPASDQGATAPAVAPAPTGVTTLPSTPPAPTSSSSQAATASSRGFVAGSFSLTLDGIPVASPKSVAGGDATGVVVVLRSAQDQLPEKHIGNVRFEDIVVTTDLGSKALNDWIAASWKGSAARKSGSIQFANYDRAIVRELDFRDALMVETTMPTLDPARKDQGHVTVRFAPEETLRRQGSGSVPSGAKIGRKWLLSAFRFEMDGLDGNRVARIDSFTVRQALADDAHGESRVSTKQPGGVEFPNLKITLRPGTDKTWLNWYEDFVIRGNNGQDRERGGAIVYLDPSLKEEIGRVLLSNCGIFSLAEGKAEIGRDQAPPVVAELYCERMEFRANAS